MLPTWQPDYSTPYRIIITTSSNSMCCKWCGVDLSNASNITYLNGNLPCCDLCLKIYKENVDGNGK